VDKADLITAWRVLEKLTVSLRKIGSHYAVEGPGDVLPPKEHRQMLRELDSFFGPELCGEITKARRALVEYIPGDEAERISERMEEKGQFWQAKS
jgi:hypothetical protein